MSNSYAKMNFAEIKFINTISYDIYITSEQIRKPFNSEPGY